MSLDDMRRSSVSPSDVISQLRRKFPPKNQQNAIKEDELPPNAKSSSSSTSSSSSPTTSLSSGGSLLKLYPSAPLRQGPKAHIQLSVLGAENLMAANKSKAKIDPLKPDRRPSLKATLYLPKAQTSTMSHSPNVKDKEKKFHQCTLDAPPIPTYNPVWTDSIYIPLPIPKALLPRVASPPTSDIVSDYKALLSYWGQGHIQIEIIDTERFNEDINLGEITLLLSSLCNTTFQKSTSSSSSDPSVLEVSGTYGLKKGKGSSRVSGSLSLRAYIHLPTISSTTSTPNNGHYARADSGDLPSPPTGDIRGILNAERSIYKEGNVPPPPPQPPSTNSTLTAAKLSISPVKSKHPSPSRISDSNEKGRSSIIAGVSQQLSSISESIESAPIMPPTPPRDADTGEVTMKQCQSPDLIGNRRASIVPTSNGDGASNAVNNGVKSNSHGRRGRAERLSMVSMALDNIMDMQQSMEDGVSLEAKLNTKHAISIQKAEPKKCL